MTRDEARAAGSKQYDGRDCKRGHGARRWTKGNGCVTCGRNANGARNRAMRAVFREARKQRAAEGTVARLRMLQERPGELTSSGYKAGPLPPVRRK